MASYKRRRQDKKDDSTEEELEMQRLLEESLIEEEEESKIAAAAALAAAAENVTLVETAVEKRRRLVLEAESLLKKKKKEEEVVIPEEPKPLSMLEEIAQAIKEGEFHEKTEEERMKEEEDTMKKEVEETKALKGVKELAHGINYEESLQSSWRPYQYLLQTPERVHDEIRDEYNIGVDGENIPPPCLSFNDMRLPPAITDYFERKKIKKPTPIQMQGLPVALSCRDMIGIAFTGSGKTLVFTLPIVLFSIEEELKMPLVRGEGPVGIILSPSRELARQTYTVASEQADVLAAAGLPKIRIMLCIGGADMTEEFHKMNDGVHLIIATPGRLIGLLREKRLSLSICRYFALDEADRLIDTGFEEEVRAILDHFSAQRQTLLFSATMPPKIQKFAHSALIRPVVVHVGRSGAANLDVVQDVEYVKDEVKLVYLLECLQKTAPPVCIFAESKDDVDDVQEYLLIKGVNAVSIHGSRSQHDREDAIARFRNGQSDVLVASDIASKGLDFPEIRHVINYDMPKEIENYVHRIGRTGRCGKTGLATTFINRSCQETTLLDLKHLLIEAKQNIPQMLNLINDPNAVMHASEEAEGDPCHYCGGLGHGVLVCPKRLEVQRKKMAGGSGNSELSIHRSAVSEGW